MHFTCDQPNGGAIWANDNSCWEGGVSELFVFKNDKPECLTTVLDDIMGASMSRDRI